MNFFTPTNQKRVEKMVETLDLLDKSAMSNKASMEDAYTLVQPLVQRIEHFIADRPGELPDATAALPADATIAVASQGDDPNDATLAVVRVGAQISLALTHMADGEHDLAEAVLEGIMKEPDIDIPAPQDS